MNIFISKLTCSLHIIPRGCKFPDGKEREKESRQEWVRKSGRFGKRRWHRITQNTGGGLLVWYRVLYDSGCSATCFSFQITVARTSRQTHRLHCDIYIYEALIVTVDEFILLCSYLASQTLFLNASCKLAINLPYTFAPLLRSSPTPLFAPCDSRYSVPSGHFSTFFDGEF